MSKLTLHHPIILLSSLYVLLTTLPILVISQPSPTEKDILLSINKQWKNIQSWDATTSHCKWPGIQCGQDQTVTSIVLNSTNIEGEIPSNICNLNNLTTLNLGDNFLGGEFPTFLYNCTKLQYLNISQNLFVGMLPNDINKLSPKLQHLILGGNNFTGSIPSSIGQLQGLITLHLELNLFNGTFPSELGNLENLEELFLAYNPFSPMSIPTEFGKLKSLKFLWMTQSNLIGEIPPSFSNLSSLEHLDLVGNSLEGSLPNGLFLLKNLTLLYLYQNTLSGELPSTIESSNLVEIDLSNNMLTGTLPEGIATLPKLQLLNLFKNKFYGELPHSLGLSSSLQTLRIWNNRFSGTLPPELGLHSKLKDFEVPNNSFTGQLPRHLCAGNTLFDVVAFNNQLNGSIPSSLVQCPSLLTIQLFNNRLSGEYPEGLWSLPNLSVLQISDNSFTGQLPKTLAWNMTRIQISNNRFSGTIPESAASWKNLVVFEASNNQFSGSIPLEFTSLPRLNLLSLDGNGLSGELPSKIMSWKNLNSLNLSHNQISGPIPASLGSLPVLNYLDLSYNQLSGKIPPAVGHLTLISLNFSSNKLVGDIPFGIDNGAYQNSFLNTNLCSDNGLSKLPKCYSYGRSTKNFPSKYLVMILVLALVVCLVSAYFTWSMISELRKRKQSQDIAIWKLTSFHRVDFTEEKVLSNLTEDNMIGSGGSGKVYRIQINKSGDYAAVKRIWSNRKLGNTLDKEFLAEVEILGTIRHLNIVKLLCCISSEDSKLLVYEYMEKQSLDQWIHKREDTPVSARSSSVRRAVLDWPERLNIAIGAAHGLSYMHHDCSPPIIHRDVKSSNILLDSEFNAKIADFGLAKILAKPGGQPHTVSAVAGSFGYMAPEYCYTTKVNEKIDIYSFGVVLLELVTGKEAHTGDEHSNLAEWAWKQYTAGHPIADVLDENVKEPCNLEEMTNVFKIGLMCTSTLPSSRPPMKEVVLLLQKCSVLHGSGRAKVDKEHDVAPLLGSGGYVSSCKNSRRAVEEDDYSMV